ncbi:hypothetical protein FT663_02205 [Candidozyma haemuli var. vulneris]|nr:hypothetical protein FT662_02404 [[Candida] haemuloni var. vulneris]KAF3992692.1 hypothetical protein FT663_02205 [[Candida] haemuloni var. vulneris]
MVFFKQNHRSLSEQLDSLARVASLMSPHHRNDSEDLDLEAQTSRRSLHSDASFISGQRSLRRTYGATDNEQVSLSSIRPIHSAFSPRTDDSSIVQDFASVHSNETRPRSPQPSFESLAPLVRQRASIFSTASSMAKFLWNRVHSPERRSFTLFHKCLALTTVVLAGGVGYYVATGRSQELWLAIASFLCWVQSRLGRNELPFCDTS